MGKKLNMGSVIQEVHSSVLQRLHKKGTWSSSEMGRWNQSKFDIELFLTYNNQDDEREITGLICSDWYEKGKGNIMRLLNYDERLFKLHLIIKDLIIIKLRSCNFLKGGRKLNTYLEILFKLAKIEGDSIEKYKRSYPEIETDFESKFKKMLESLRSLPDYQDYDCNKPILFDFVSMISGKRCLLIINIKYILKNFCLSHI